MKKLPILFILLVLLLSGVALFRFITHSRVSGAPPYGAPESEAPEEDEFAWLANWTRPEGPPRVGLQVGHWENDELPDELERLKGNTGSSGRGKWEWEVNLAIAERAKERLIEKGIVVDILPATVPPSYWADVFIAIHADGSTDRSKSGYKFAYPWRDFTRKAGKLVSFLEEAYGPATGLAKDINISRNMRGYYAFSWWRYEHAVHPMTTSAIAETGFLTNSGDSKLLVKTPDISANGLAEGVANYLEAEGLLQ